MTQSTNYHIYAIRYATREAKAPDHFHGVYKDIHADRSMPMDYFVWVITSGERTILVDTGFSSEVGDKRGRTTLRDPAESLRVLGIDPSTIEHVIITHMHYDHIGNLPSFPNATFYVQDQEMAFWTGRHASEEMFLHHVEEEDVVYLVRKNFHHKLQFVDGDEELFPGVKVWKTGGHSAGLQFVTVDTGEERIVLASDAAHFYENLEKRRPFSTIHDLQHMYTSFDKINSVMYNKEFIVPGHDPLVMEKFERVSEDPKGYIVKII